MLVKNAGVVAVGVVSAVAAMSSSAAAAPVSGAHQGTLATAGNLDLARWLEPTQVQPLITIGVGSSVTAALIQNCAGASTTGVGATLAAGQPKIQIGDCRNANIQLKQDMARGLISILDDSSINAAAWQFCASNSAIGAAATLALNSPAGMIGDCTNANTVITAADGSGGTSLISVLSGSVVNLVPWQFCGTSAAVGASLPFNSPTILDGSCYNAGITIQKLEPHAAIPLLSNIGLNILPLQFCGDQGLIQLSNLLPLNSPGVVTGECQSPSILDFKS